MAEAMNRLKKSGESVDKQLKDEQSSSNDFITQLLSQLGDLNLDADQNEIDGAAALEGGQGDDQLMNNLLNDLISQLISKKILKKINNDQENKYTKQYEIVMKIVNKFDEKDYEDLKDFPFINKHLEELQELGMPPKELVGENDGLNEIFGGNFNINNNDTNNSFEEGIGKDDEIPEDVQKQLEENCKQV
ncbi:hypothetical protein PACTADRAFT_49525 [Pachysolen tannophilus NRRL Y-2460]|uniref:Uncharacterized protein n=1 Tax=Pachysolen tannophilus NRRL Y-2460 TaxID=669874 RepID=A0A1E4TWK8_PACTA|nr:hypothetical protein PACTADRAFT_49525 [Pachysolen tannophilus NRRL Y-2460]